VTDCWSHARLEQLVFEALTAQDGGLLTNPATASEAIDAADRAVDEAEHELEQFAKNPTLLTTRARTCLSSRCRRAKLPSTMAGRRSTRTSRRFGFPGSRPDRRVT
jgi:hypothetical protein